jgi:nucleotide-binding universal stress UspA family protein
VASGTDPSSGRRHGDHGRFAGVEEQVIRQYVTTSIETRPKRLHDMPATAELAQMAYSARVIHGSPSQQIIAMEQEVDGDLIVVGKYGSQIAGAVQTARADFGRDCYLALAAPVLTTWRTCR